MSTECATAIGAACFNDLREVVAWACSVEVAICDGEVRCPPSAPRPLARFVSMISAKLRRGHALSAEHEFGAQASRVDGVACAKKRKRYMTLLLMMVMVMVMMVMVMVIVMIVDIVGSSVYRSRELRQSLWRAARHGLRPLWAVVVPIHVAFPAARRAGPSEAIQLRGSR